jgi:N,N'-diacetyllegionaminate synthase
MRTIIIAEIGVNHNGKIKVAKKLIDKAKEAGVDYVKFQSFVSDEVVTDYSELAGYQKKKKLKNVSQLDLLKKYELSFKNQKILFLYCKKKKIKFISTPFDTVSVKFLKNKINLFKVSSTDLGNLPLLNQIGRLKKKVLLSTGMSNLSEITKSIYELVKAGTNKKNITVLHCTSSYPSNFSELNLKSIHYLRDKLRLPIGFSDHSQGIEASLAAVALGATVIEKHFTLKKNMLGPDHSSSLDPLELKSLVVGIRKIEKSIGKYRKKITKNEIQNKKKLKKSIVAVKKIVKGDVFNERNLTTKRPGNGISPIKWYKILGKKAKKTFFKDEQIKI